MGAGPKKVRSAWRYAIGPEGMKIVQRGIKTGAGAVAVVDALKAAGITEQPEVGVLSSYMRRVRLANGLPKLRTSKAEREFGPQRQPELRVDDLKPPRKPGWISYEEWLAAGVALGYASRLLQQVQELA